MTDVHVDNDTNRNPENDINCHSRLLRSLNLNDITIEDIEEVIKKDKAGSGTNHHKAVAAAGLTRHQPIAVNMDGGVGSGGVAGPSHRGKPCTKILIQPAQKALRFRYECEGRSAGSIPGVNSTPENKTYPTIQVMNYVGRAVVIVSCVTKDPPYRPHPHKLVGKESCKKGICTVSLNSENMICSFSNLGIQCVKRKDIEDALREREEARVDPFGTTFAHKNQTGNIDLNSVRLCFQVFLENEREGTFTIPLPPVVSDPIFDKKAMCDLVICKLSSCSASVLGQTEIILLCEKIVRDDIQVRFYEQKDGQVVWEGYGDFQPSDVHKQVAISLKTPRYRDIELQEPVEVFIQLRRPSDGNTSEPRTFQFLPVDSDQEALNKKRRKIANASLDLYLAENTMPHRRPGNPMMGDSLSRSVMERLPVQRAIRQAKPRIKTEPVDGGYAVGMPTNPYPQQAVGGAPLLGMHQPPDPMRVPVQPMNPYYRMPVHQAPSPMDTAPSPYSQMASPGGGAGHGPSTIDMYAMSQMTSTARATPEVITVSSYSSAGSNPSVVQCVSNPDSAADGAQQALSSGSTHLSLGLGSLDSLPLSEMSLSIFGSHFSDTFLCLNPDNLSGGLTSQVEFSGGSGAGREDFEPQQPQSREPSMDSLGNIQHLQDQIRELNQLGAVGGMSMNPEYTYGKPSLKPSPK